VRKERKELSVEEENEKLSMPTLLRTSLKREKEEMTWRKGEEGKN